MNTNTAASTVSTPAAPVNAPSSTQWTIDASHSEVGFRVRHMMVSWTRGKFDRFAGTVELDEQDLSKSKIDVSIEAASINTNTADRDAHLKSPDFFDAAKFPSLTFKSSRVEPGVGGALNVHGALEIRGVSKPVVLHVEPLSPSAKDPWGGTRRGTRATTKLNRKDYGLNWNAALELGGVLVGDEVEITLEVELIKK
ncbi:MAG: YceI family protein [Archangium sp.]